MKRRKLVQIIGFVILAFLALALVYLFLVCPWHLTRGVSPSPRVKRGVFSVTGRKSLYLNKTPRFMTYYCS